MKKQQTIPLAAMCLFAFAGGMTAQYATKAIIPRASASDVPAASIMNSAQEYHDQKDRLRLKIGMEGEIPEESLWGEDGKPRLVLGNAGDMGEDKDLPAMRLYDNQGHLKLVLRIAAGKNQSPVLVMKDSQNRDRIMMGLAPEEPGEDPFLVYVDKDGTKHSVFGNF